MADNIKLDLDPQKILDSLKEISKQAEGMSRSINESMNKASQGVNDLEDASAKGAAKVGKFFSDLGHRVREDMKEAFNVTGLLTGLKFAQEIQAGVKSVFEMELAFARLNTRLKLTVDQLTEFKRTVGRNAADAGQKAQDILPGVEVAASRGGISSPAQLSDISKVLSQARAATGESSDSMAESVVDILKDQGKAVNSVSFHQVLDALQGARVNGNFRTLGDAGAATARLAQYTGTGLSIREMAGLSAQGSLGGEGALSVLDQILAKSKDVGGRQYLNAMFGQQLFKGNKLDASALGKINLSRLGGLDKEQFGQITGFTGAAGSDLVRLVQSFSHGTQEFNRVVRGSNETAAQFAVASDNLATEIEQFKRHAGQAGAEVGDAIKTILHGVGHGNGHEVMKGAKDAAESAWENKGTIAASLGLTAAVGVFSGGAIRKLLGRAGGIGAGLAEGKALDKAMGVQSVYVVNANEFGTGGGSGASAADSLGMFGMAGLGIYALYGAAALTGGAAGYGLSQTGPGQTLGDATIGKLFDSLDLGGVQKAQAAAQQQEMDGAKRLAERNGISEAVAMGMLRALREHGPLNIKSPHPVTMTNPSDVTGRGRKRGN